MIGYFNQSFGKGVEGLINYSNSVVDWWMVPIYLLFVFLALIITFSKDRQHPMVAIIGYSFLSILFGAIIFKLITTVGENVIYVIIVGLAVSIGWGIWQSMR